MQPSFREITMERETLETSISLRMNLDGSGQVSVETGYGMADHMITLMAFWAGFDLSIQCRGDLEVDAHHTVEDIGLLIGQALRRTLGDKKGIARVGCAKVPMDEALAEVCIDLSGRPYHVMRGQELLPAIIAGEENDLWREFFKSVANEAGMNLHVLFHYGQNGHHLLESAFKSLGLALRSAIRQERTQLLSTKGSLS